MSDISELEGRLSTALERIARGVDAMQAVVAEPAEGEDVQALRRALENEALVTAQMEERVRALTMRQAELEADLSTAQEARVAAEESAKAVAESQAEASQALTAAEARAEAAETAAAAAAEKLEAAEANAAAAPAAAPEADAPAPVATDESRALLEELAKRLRRLRQMVRRERGANQRLRTQVEQEDKVDAALVNDALKADLETLTALREAEVTETALIIAELRTLVQGVPDEDLSVMDDMVSAVAQEDATNEAGDA